MTDTPKKRGRKPGSRGRKRVPKEPPEPAPKMGRPRVTPAELPNGWEKSVLALYSEGAADVEVRDLIREWRGGEFSISTWNRWLDDEPHFAKIITRGREKAEIWWHQVGRQGLGHRDFNANLYRLQMANRFGWSDKVSVDANVKREPPPDLSRFSTEELEAWVALSEKARGEDTHN